jgi:hypothetical protein
MDRRTTVAMQEEKGRSTETISPVPSTQAAEQSAQIAKVRQNSYSLFSAKRTNFFRKMAQETHLG